MVAGYNIIIIQILTCWLFKYRLDSCEVFPDLPQRRPERIFGEVELQLFLAVLQLLLQLRPGALDGEPLFVKEALDFQERLDVLSLVHPVLGSILRGSDAELGFPETQNVRLHSQDPTDLADLEMKLVRYLGGDHAFRGGVRTA